MIRHATDLGEGAVLDADVAVVGAGLAGIDIARQLGRRGLRVVLLESGRLEFDQAIQNLARASFAGKPLRTPETHSHLSSYLPPMYRGYCRLRQFGGTTNIWTGKWRIFDPQDFELRPWIPNSGWPIALSDLLPFYEETARDYGFGHFEEEAAGAFFRQTRRLLAPARLEPHLFYWEKTPTRSGPRFFQELKGAPTVDVVLGATATAIRLTDGLDHAHSVVFRSLDRRTFTLHARYFVLSAGGLEVPRLLLASNGQIPRGIGNGRDLVGRFFMDHPKDMRGQLLPGGSFSSLSAGVRTRPRPRFGISFSLSAAAQQAASLPNHAVYVRNPAPTLFPGRTRFPIKLGIEQIPNPGSRVYLGAERDALGMPQLVVDWRFTPRDHEALATLVPALIGAFAEAGLGRLDFGPTPVSLDAMGDASHHMGTTRMAADPSCGVVDSDCGIFGVDNLFVASSSVFATAHAYSPTFTILAIARRVASHLANLATRAAPAAAHSLPSGDVDIVRTAPGLIQKPAGAPE